MGAEKKARCVECGIMVRIPEYVSEGDTFFCDACDAFLRLVSTDPCELEEVDDDFDNLATYMDGDVEDDQE